MTMSKHPIDAVEDIRGFTIKDGVVMAVTPYKIMRLDLQDNVWSQVASAPSGYFFLSIQSTARGYVATTDSGRMMLSTDGITWLDGQSSGLGTPTYSGEKVSLCIADSKLWLLKNNTNSLYVANAGQSFTQVPTAMSFEKILPWADGIIGEAGEVGRYFQDGISWFEFPLPARTTPSW